MGLWLVDGPGDLVWHSLFGIEENINALYSPTHLIPRHGASAGLERPLAEPVGAAGLAHGPPRPTADAALAGSYALNLTFFVQFAHSVTNR